eukprot:Skav220814  [mRNA]  locus=scaffold150:526618:534315:+ [translate_table: standard]
MAVPTCPTIGRAQPSSGARTDEHQSRVAADDDGWLVVDVEFRRQTSLYLRTNRSLLAAGGNMFDRCATFEGWEGLSSVSSRYRNHRHPHMEDVILAASETLNRRIEQERVRQMLFLGPHQHVALHFKVAADGVILQTRFHLIMADPCMTEESQPVPWR